ncbi:MAG: Rrf2 family transcriptional regulator [Candidatus Cloacimonetes bacterium]|nr:Rrf2 family transcriptional regulator [Candidatus Cloacimonadota bacterium]MBS3767891.1 Rrf2 family transcriptional regulator [Candidatus Cloacimonadota bacterium]
MYLLNISEGPFLSLHGLYIIGKRAPERTTAQYIADKLNGSRAHVAKIFQRLAKRGVVKSYCGPAGGFTLIEKAKKLSLLEILEKSGENVLHSDCPFNRDDCPFEECILSDKIHDLSDELYNEFKNTTLQDLLDEDKNAGII